MKTKIICDIHCFGKNNELCIAGNNSCPFFHVFERGLDYCKIYSKEIKNKNRLPECIEAEEIIKQDSIRA